MKSYQKIALMTFFLLLVSGFANLYAKAPTLDPADDARHFGPPEKILMWTPEQQVAGYRNMDKLRPTRKISAGESVLELPEKLVDLGATGCIFRCADPVSQSTTMKMPADAGILLCLRGLVIPTRWGNHVAAC